MGGRFTLVRVLGTGGFATVYLAEDSALRRQVAIKLLHEDLAKDPSTVRRFETEARAAANLRHPNIVGVYDVGTSDDGRPYLVTEFLSGSPLSQVLTESGALSVEFVLRIVTQLASALDCMHGQGVIHRDVKPSNVMLGESGRVTLMDFGSVRELTPEARRTLTGELLGTLDYMAPEQIAGGAITPATDVYALGLLAYELLTGEPPFTGPPARVMHDQVYRPPPLVRERKPGVPVTVERAIADALAKAPRERPQSAMAFAYRLAAQPERPWPRRQAAGGGHTFADERERSGAAPRKVALAWSSAGALLLVIFLLAFLGVSQLSGRGRTPAAAGSRAPAASSTASRAQTAPTATPRAGLAQPASTRGQPAAASPTATQTTTVPRNAPVPVLPAAAANPGTSATATPSVPTVRQSAQPAAAAPPSAAASPASCTASVGGDWQFTDVIRYGNGTGQQYSFNVRLFQQGSQVTGSGTLSLAGRLDGCVLQATFGQSGGSGEFIWTFSPDGSQFSGTFSAPAFGNGGDSLGRRLSGP